MSAPVKVRLDMLCAGDVIRVQGARAAEVQNCDREAGINATVGVAYIECKSGRAGTVTGPSDEQVTLLRSSALRAA